MPRVQCVGTSSRPGRHLDHRAEVAPAPIASCAARRIRRWRQRLAGNRPSHNLGLRRLCDVDFGHGFWTPSQRLGGGVRVVAETFAVSTGQRTTGDRDGPGMVLACRRTGACTSVIHGALAARHEREHESAAASVPVQDRQPQQALDASPPGSTAGPAPCLAGTLLPKFSPRTGRSDDAPVPRGTDHRVQRLRSGRVWLRARRPTVLGGCG
jgi:hypothetical protein